eukprot:evm.model.NODE_25078_length_8269_cov_19.407787.2
MELEAPPEDLEIPSASQFLAAFYPAIGVAVVCLFAFPLLHPHFPDVYDAKRERVRLGGSSHQRGDLAGMPPERPKFTLDWLKLLWSLNDDDILRFVGADALMFLRYLRVCFKAACLMLIYGLCVLVPINSIGANMLSEFEKYSASNVADGSQLLWAHFVGAYLLTFLLMYLLFKEYQTYVELRQQFMKSPTVQSYSIIIRDIPKDVDRGTVERYLFELLGSVVFFIIFCYIIPISLVASLANLNALAQTKGLTWLQPVADYNPKFTAFLQGFVPPLVASIFFSLVPTFMVMLSRKEALISESDAQTSAIWKVFLFVLFDYFLVYTFAGSVAAKMSLLKHYAETPADIINLF